MNARRRASPNEVPQEVFDVRRANLLRLIEQHGGLKAGGMTRLAAALGHASASRLSQLVSGIDDISERVARSMEKALDLEPYSFDDPSMVVAKAPKAVAAPRPVAAPAADDAELLMGCFRAVLEVLQAQRVTLSADKQTDVIALAHADAKMKGSPDMAFIERLVRLAK